MENILVRYSEFFDDDGGMAKVKSDFMKLGDELIAEAKRVKKEFNDAFSLENTESLGRYESKVAKLIQVNEQYEQAKKDLLAIEKAYLDALAKTNAEEIKSERLKAAKADTIRKELAAERELERGIQQSNTTKKSAIALSEAQRRQSELNANSLRKEKDAYGQMSAELNKLFRASASVAVQLYNLEEAGKKNTPEFARLNSEFTVLQQRTLKLDKALKQIDASLGRNQRNVGNYKFDSIGNSLQQILREAPSAAVSLNTFFLAISNNLPMFFDSVTDLTAEIKELRAAAAAATEQLLAQQTAQATAKQISDAATESLGAQVEELLSSVEASAEQAVAIREQVAAHIAEAESNGMATAATIENTESLLINAGATADQTATLQRQIAATAQATAVTAEATVALNAEAAAAARASAALAAQPTILQRIKASLFSVNALLTAGVLVLTLYGGKIIDLVGSLFEFNKALTEVEKSQLRLAQASAEGQKAFQRQADELNVLQQTAKNQDLDMDSRMLAVQKLREQFQYYYKDLTDAQILSAKYSKSEEELLKAIGKRTQAQAKQKEVDNVKDRLIDIRNEISERDKIYGQATRLRAEYDRLVNTQKAGSKEEFLANLARRVEIQEELKQIDVRAEKYEDFNKTLEDGNEIRKYLNETATDDLIREAESLEKYLIPKQKEINKLQSESILLDYKKEKATKTKQISTVDYQASEYELIRTMLENTIQNNRDIYDSDKYTLEQRLAAREVFLKQMKTLAEEERTEALRLLKRTYDEERKETVKSADGKSYVLKYSNKGLLELQKQFQFDSLKIEEDYQQTLVNIAKESDEVDKLRQLQMQMAKLERDRQFFGKSATIYKAYTREISGIQNEINKIVNPLAGLELSDQIGINDAEIAKVKELRAKLEKILNGRSLSELNPLERKSLLKEIEEFEKERTRVESNYDTQRKLNRIHSIEEEQKQYKEDTNEFKTLETERQNLLLDLENKGIDDMLTAQKDKAEKFKKFLDEINQIVGAVLDRMIQVTQQRVEESQRLLDKQQKAVEDQQARAQNGLQNTLKFEQEELAKREAEVIKQQRREQRLQKIKALYNSYASYADKDPDTAVAKALRDFAVLEAISASFGEGGAADDVLKDKIPHDGRGIIRGRSHRGRNGGIPVLIEGKEGFFSGREMGNLGKDNFYRMKEMAGQGKVDENFFTRQGQQFVQTVGVPVMTEAILGELQDLRRAVENKPVPNWRVDEVADGTMKLVEETLLPNMVKRNIHIIKKPRL